MTNPLIYPMDMRNERYGDYDMYGLISSMLQSYSVWIVVLGIIAMVKRQQEPPEWRERGLTREQQVLENAQYLTYRKEVYKQYPRLEMFEQTKKIWAFFLTLVYFITYVLNIFATIEVNRESATMLGIVVSFLVLLGGSSIVLGVFLVAMGPKWKLAILLYVIGIGQIVLRIHAYITNGIDSWDKFWSAYTEGFQMFPAVFGADILTMVFNVFILLTAVWLTAFKRNRKLAELSDALDRKTKYDFMAERIEMDTDMDID